MRILPASDDEAIEEAVAILDGGGLVAVPTETVYGLAADATSQDAVERIYAAKGRPSFNPLIAHVADDAMARRHGAFDAVAERLARAFWPGPLTLVVATRERLAPAVHAGLPTVALRRPIGPMAALCRRLGRPLAAPSANPSGRLSATTAAHVADAMGDRVDLILDGGTCEGGIESTIVAVGGPRVLRPGPIGKDEIARVAAASVGGAGPAIEAPGMMASHYAPRAVLRLDADGPRDGEAMLGFGPVEGDVSLSPSGDLVEAAHRLYAALAELDARAVRIAVAPIPREGLGVAINDRLARAAADRTR